MRFWAGLGFSTGLAGVALLSACSTKELLAPTPAVFTAPQNRLAVDGAQPINASGDLNLLYSLIGRQLRIPKRQHYPTGPSARAP